MARFVPPEVLAAALADRVPVTRAATATGFPVTTSWATVCSVELGAGALAVTASFDATGPGPLQARVLVGGAATGEAPTAALAPDALWPGEAVYPSEELWPSEGAESWRSQGAVMAEPGDGGATVALQVRSSTPYESEDTSARLFARADRGPR